MRAHADARGGNARAKDEGRDITRVTPIPTSSSTNARRNRVRTPPLPGSGNEEPK